MLRPNRDDEWLRKHVNWDIWYRYTAAGVDRIPDMARTATNVVGVLAAGAVVDQTEEAQDTTAVTED